MAENDRLNTIRSLLKSRRTVTVKELAALLYVSETTVRRDLRALEKEKGVKRVHGGALPGPEMRSSLYPYDLRLKEMPDAKALIARQAMQWIQPGQMVYLDASTTADAIARLLPADRNLRVLTTGVKTALILADRGLPTLITGGMVRDDMGDITGYHADEMLRELCPDVMFCSARGLSPDGCFCTSSPEGASVSAAAMKQARRVVMCITSSKLGREFPLVFARLEDVDAVLCDRPLSPELQARVGLNRKSRTNGNGAVLNEEF